MKEQSLELSGCGYDGNDMTQYFTLLLGAATRDSLSHLRTKVFLFQWSKTGRRSGGVTLITTRGIGLGDVAAVGLSSPLFPFIINIVVVTVCFLISFQFPANCSFLSPCLLLLYIQFSSLAMCRWKGKPVSSM